MKAVAVVLAGRKKYLECLVPYLLRDKHLFDHIQLWDNASDEDKEYLEELVERYPELFVLKDIPDREHMQDQNDAAHRVANLAKFYRHTTDPDTLYVKLDDDIVWVAEGALEKLIAYRLANPDWWMVLGNVVNNSATYLLHRGHDVPWDREYPTGIFRVADAGNVIHADFLARLRAGTLAEYDFGVWDSKTTRQIPNQVYAYMGSDWEKFGGRVPSSDEYLWLTTEMPAKLGRRHCIYGPSLFVHYSYFPQQEGIDSKYLKAYKQLALEVLCEVN